MLPYLRAVLCIETCIQISHAIKPQLQATEVDWNQEFIAPTAKDVQACGEGLIKNVGSQLGCGAEGCTWQARTKVDEDVIVKVALPEHEQSIVKECKFAKKLQAAGIERALRCLGNCTYGLEPLKHAVVLSPLVKGAQEFGTANKINLGSPEKTINGIVEMLQTAWQMLHAGFVNVDQANNILFYPESGDPVFIDFGRARQPTKDDKATLVGMQVRKMLQDILLTIIPTEHACTVKKEVMKLQGELPPSEVLAPYVKAAFDGAPRTPGIKEQWEKLRCE